MALTKEQRVGVVLFLQDQGVVMRRVNKVEHLHEDELDEHFVVVNGVEIMAGEAWEFVPSNLNHGLGVDFTGPAELARVIADALMTVVHVESGH